MYFQLFCFNSFRLFFINEAFLTPVKLLLTVLTPLGYSSLMKWSGINKWGKRVSIGDIYICFVLHYAFTQVARISLKSCPKHFQELPKRCSFHQNLAQKLLLINSKKSVSTSDEGKSLHIYSNYLLL